MPREERRIFFQYDEAYRAVYFMSFEKGLPAPPSGHVLLIEHSPEGGTGLDFTIENEKTGGVEIVSFSRDFVLAALTMMCRGIGIPLPKGGNKSMEIVPDKLVIRVDMVRKST